MVELSAAMAERVAAPPLAPVDQAIDLTHLTRMTLGEASLEREVLQLFDRQAEMLLARMRHAAPCAVGAFAHTLKGSSRGIGAWRVASEAETVELTAVGGDVTAVTAALDRLGAAVDEARLVIAELLRAH